MYIWIHKTTFPRRENKLRDTKRGQKDAWIAKKGVEYTKVSLNKK